MVWNSSLLEQLLKKNQQWEKFKRILTKSVNFDLKDMSEEMRKSN